MSFEPIEDWTLEGRAALVDSRGDELWLLLYRALSSVHDTHDLAAFGWRGEERVDVAVAWCLNRFARGDLDGDRITHRSFELFTIARFWLAQKVGARNVDRVLARARPRASDPRRQVAAEPPPSEEPVLPPSSVVTRLGQALRGLSERTCADLVQAWLDGKGDLAAWLGRPPVTGGPLGELTKRDRSFVVHDARARFVVLMLDLVSERTRPLEVVARQMFSGVPNDWRSRYRVPDDDIARALGFPGVRAVQASRKQGLECLLGELLDYVDDELEDADASWFQDLTRTSLSRTTLQAYRIKARELVDRMET